MANPLAAQKAQSRTLIRLPRVERITGRGRSQIYRGVVDGTFPRPVRIGARAVAWIEAEVQQWINDRIAERDARTKQGDAVSTGAAHAAPNTSAVGATVGAKRFVPTVPTRADTVAPSQ